MASGPNSFATDIAPDLMLSQSSNNINFLITSVEALVALKSLTSYGSYSLRSLNAYINDASLPLT